jgi:hypothetical protein
MRGGGKRAVRVFSRFPVQVHSSKAGLNYGDVSFVSLQGLRSVVIDIPSFGR